MNQGSEKRFQGSEKRFQGPFSGTKLATAYRLHGDQKAIDRLVERHPNLAGRIGDSFIQDEDKDWPRAVEIYSRGITPQTTDVDLLSKRALAHETLKNWAAAAADWSRAATGNPEEANLLAEFAQRLAVVGQVSMATTHFAKAQALYERTLAADPDNDVAATELARLLVNKSENENSSRWTTLTPTELKSAGGAVLTLQPDGSVLASGTNPARDSYTLAAKTDLEHITALRLEALTDPSLPASGPGRAPDGNFHFNELRVFSRGLPAPLTNIFVDHDYRGQFRNVIDGKLDDTVGWNNFANPSKSNSAVIATSVDRARGDDLKIEVYFAGTSNYCNLGRFRLSVTGDPGALERYETRFAALKVTDPWTKLGAAYALNGRHDEALRYFGKALERAVGYEARKPILELAARFEDIISGLAEHRPDDPQLQMALARNLARRGTRRLAEQPAQAQADLEKSRETLTRLRAAPRWTVLTPTEMKSEQGATLTTLDDRSILASGENPPNDSFTLAFRRLPPIIRGLRLEVLPHESLPSNGPGRNPGGDFLLTTVRAQLDSPRRVGASRELKLGKAYADNDRSNSNVSNVTDAYDNTGWGVHPEIGKSHSAVLEFAEPVATTESAELRVNLEFESPWLHAAIGRFRLSVTDDAETLAGGASLLDLKDGELVDLSVALAQAQAQQGHIDEAAASFAEAIGLVPDSGGKARILTEAAALKGVLEKLAERAAGDTRFLKELTQFDDVVTELHRHLPNDKPIHEAYLKRVDKTAAEFSKKLDALPDRREASADRSQLILSVIRRRDDVFERLLKLRPKDSLLPVCVARDLVLKSDWPGAASAYAKIVEKTPLSEEWYEYAAAMLLADKTKDYAEFMKRAAAKAIDPLDPFVAHSLARAAAVSPTPAVPPENAVRWAQRALGDAKNPWFPHTAGLAHLRTGNLEQALKLLGESLATPWCPQLNHLALALVHAQRKDAAGAREHLKLAEKWFQDQAPLKTNGYHNGQVTDWLEANLLLREAKALIEGNDAAKGSKK